MASYTIQELEGILATLKEAYQRAAESGGVVSYSINSGQGSTNVTQASLGSLRGEIEYYSNLLNEMKEIQAGSHCTAIRGLGAL